jgi:DNA-binding transcriptional LysR family regulator
MEWDDLKYFLAVARSGSLADAARKLKSSPATVGRRIVALETQLGARLFDRNPSGYTLTENGEAIRVRAEEVEHAVLTVERAALGRDLRPAGRVRLATANEIASNVLAPQLAEFRRRYPDIVLEIVGELDIANLARREADIALRTVRPEHGDLVVYEVGSWKSGLYAAKSYADAHGLKPGLSDFSNLDVITWTEEYAHLRDARWFAEHAPDGNVVLEANSRRIHYTACKAGIGLAILPCLAADRDPELVRLLPPEQVSSPSLYAAVHRDLVTTARVRACLDFLREEIDRSTG